GNIFMTGHFEDTVTFDTQSVTSAGGKDVYVVKYNSSGAVVWLTHAGGTSDDESRGIAVDNNNVFITGRFAGSATFGTSNLISTAVSNDVFIAQLNPSGVFQWALSAGGSGSDDAYDASVDGAGNCYVAGYFHDTISFGTDTLMSSGNDDAFIAKYNSSGTALWAKRAGGVNGDRAYSVAADVSGKVYITGSFEDTASFNSTNLISNGDKDIFVAEYNSSGVLQWAMRAGGSGFDRGYGITTDQSGNVYTTGVFEQTASFGTLPVISSGLLDFFLTKISAPVGMIELNVEESCIHVYPNPADSKVHVEYKDIANSKVAVYDVTGQKIFEKSNCSLVDLSAFNNGLYFIVLTDMRKNITYSKTELLNK
ncbi:MAG: SBBP repeat-containing protein, partial [Bacteroidia bacterium]